MKSPWHILKARFGRKPAEGQYDLFNPPQGRIAAGQGLYRPTRRERTGSWGVTRWPGGKLDPEYWKPAINQRIARRMAREMSQAALGKPVVEIGKRGGKIIGRDSKGDPIYQTTAKPKPRRDATADDDLRDAADDLIFGPPKKEGQLWEPCERCGREPSNMPLLLCDRCWPKMLKARYGRKPAPGQLGLFDKPVVEIGRRGGKIVGRDAKGKPIYQKQRQAPKVKAGTYRVPPDEAYRTIAAAQGRGATVLYVGPLDRAAATAAEVDLDAMILADTEEVIPTLAGSVDAIVIADTTRELNPNRQTHAQPFYHQEWGTWVVGHYERWRGGTAVAYTGAGTEEQARHTAWMENSRVKPEPTDPPKPRGIMDDANWVAGSDRKVEPAIRHTGTTGIEFVGGQGSKVTRGWKIRDSGTTDPKSVMRWRSKAEAIKGAKKIGWPANSVHAAHNSFDNFWVLSAGMVVPSAPTPMFMTRGSYRKMADASPQRDAEALLAKLLDRDDAARYIDRFMESQMDKPGVDVAKLRAMVPAKFRPVPTDPGSFLKLSPGAYSYFEVELIEGGELAWDDEDEQTYHELEMAKQLRAGRKKTGFVLPDDPDVLALMASKLTDYANDIDAGVSRGTAATARSLGRAVLHIGAREAYLRATQPDPLGGWKPRGVQKGRFLAVYKAVQGDMFGADKHIDTSSQGKLNLGVHDRPKKKTPDLIGPRGGKWTILPGGKKVPFRDNPHKKGDLIRDAEGNPHTVVGLVVSKRGNRHGIVVKTPRGRKVIPVGEASRHDAAGTKGGDLFSEPEGGAGSKRGYGRAAVKDLVQWAKQSGHQGELARAELDKRGFDRHGKQMEGATPPPPQPSEGLKAAREWYDAHNDQASRSDQMRFRRNMQKVSRKTPVGGVGYEHMAYLREKMGLQHRNTPKPVQEDLLGTKDLFGKGRADGGWTSIPGGKRGGERRPKAGGGYEYRYQDPLHNNRRGKRKRKLRGKMTGYERDVASGAQRDRDDTLMWRDPKKMDDATLKEAISWAGRRVWDEKSTERGRKATEGLMNLGRHYKDPRITQSRIADRHEELVKERERRKKKDVNKAVMAAFGYSRSER